MLAKKDILNTFRMLGLLKDSERKSMLSQGQMEIKDKPEEDVLTQIVSDNVTGLSINGRSDDAKLE